MLVLGSSCFLSRSTCASSSARRTVSRSFSLRRVRPLLSKSRRPDDDDEPLVTKEEFHTSFDSARPITWYPGHIAKAERALADYLKKVDVVIEVRDARIPLATTHPMVPEWVGSKPLIVAIARIDQISRKALDSWKQYYTVNPLHESRPDAKVFFIDGKLGSGILALKKEALKAGIALNERREKRGIQPRAVRAAIIGFPNVGKSALINRLLGLDVEREGGIELLDSPGIIPARQIDQEAAMKLAICNDIGEAAYDRSTAAAAMCELVIKLNSFQRGYVDMKRITERYEIPFDTLTGEDIVYDIAQKFYRGNTTASSDKLLGDFRRGFMGYCSLEAPGMLEKRKEEKNEEKIKKNLAKKAKAAQDLAHSRSDYVSRYDIGDKIYKDEVGDAIPKKKKIASLDIRHGDYEGW